MKLSDATFSYFLQKFINEKGQEAFKQIFTLEGKGYISIDYKLIPSVYNELMEIARKADPDYDSSFTVGEMVDAYWDFPKLSFYTRLAGDPEPYSEDPEEEPDFDAIGEWTIDVQTKEVRFIVDITG